MGTFSDYLENKWLAHILEGSAFTVPTTVALALHTGDPGDTGASNEVANSNNYARVSCKTAFSSAASSRIISNQSDIVFNQASGSWGTISYWSLWDSATYGAGNCLATGSFSTGKAIGSNQTPKVLALEIDISIPAGNGMTDYLANEMLDHTFKNSDAGFSQPTIYLALGVTSAFGDGGLWTNEVANSGAYARAGTSWTVTGSAATNNGAITFTTATGSWGTVAYYGLADSGSHNGGNMLLYGTWDSSSAITTDDQFQVDDGALDITLT